uniref:Uncharacterized protein n=1 Tax=Amphiprion ocellaris TaxID=80972 RepID=A0AAQ5YJ03_AMPOC
DGFISGDNRSLNRLHRCLFYPVCNQITTLSDPCPLCDEAKEVLQPFKHRVRL